MKHYFFLCLLLLFSCNNNTKTVLSGTIENPKSDYVHLTVGDSLLTQKLDKTKSFKFEIDLKKSGYYRFDHEEYTYLYLTPGKNLRLKLDTKKFDETLVYTGDLAIENNYIAWQTVEFKNLKNQRSKLYNLEQDKFKDFIDSASTNLNTKLLSISNSDTLFVSTEKKKNEEFKQSYLDNYSKMHLLQAGNTAPEFKCKDKNGNDISLKKFKGKVLCIDVWATWCTGCLKEMPSFDRIKEKYASSPIQFISISIDDDKDRWLNTIQKKDFKGVQLWAEGGKKSQFALDYYLQECGVPCFIIIDNEGLIINTRAPRPSENLEEILMTLDKKI
jgi:thiol-disulfide isomerase/thioredoxin